MLIGRMSSSQCSAVPAVIVKNLPSQLSLSGDATCQALLGPKAGKDVGVLFWRVHPSQAKFMVAFKTREERDQWHDTSRSLNNIKAKFGVLTSSVWFNRESGVVIKGDTVEEKRESKPHSCWILQDDFEDLDQMFSNMNSQVESQMQKKSPVDVDESTGTEKGQPVQTNKSTTEKKSNIEIPNFLLPMSEFVSHSQASNTTSLHQGQLEQGQVKVKRRDVNINISLYLIIFQGHLGTGRERRGVWW